MSKTIKVNLDDNIYTDLLFVAERQDKTVEEIESYTLDQIEELEGLEQC